DEAVAFRIIEPLHGACCHALSLSCRLSYRAFTRAMPGTPRPRRPTAKQDRKSTRLNSSHLVISYAVFCLKKKKKKTTHYVITIQYIAPTLLEASTYASIYHLTPLELKPVDAAPSALSFVVTIRDHLTRPR